MRGCSARAPPGCNPSRRQAFRWEGERRQTPASTGSKPPGLRGGGGPPQKCTLTDPGRHATARRLRETKGGESPRAGSRPPEPRREELDARSGPGGCSRPTPPPPRQLPRRRGSGGSPRARTLPDSRAANVASVGESAVSRRLISTPQISWPEKEQVPGQPRRRGGRHPATPPGRPALAVPPAAPL